MRVVHVYDGHERVLGDGSLPDVVWSLARRTAARGHDVTVVERRWAGDPAREERDGVAFDRLRVPTGSDEPWTDVPYEMVGSVAGTARLLVDRTAFAAAAWRRLRPPPDVVHVHLPFAANVLALDPRLARRMVYTAHLGETEKRVVEPLVSPDALLARRAARTVALNPRMAESFVDRGVPESRVEVVPNGVDVERFDGVTAAERERVRRAYDLSGTVALFVGTVTPRKRVVDLVEAAGRVLPDRDATLVVAGATDLDPEHALRAEELAVDAGVGDSVVFTGFVPEADLLALYDLADVFVLPSAEEGSSVAVAEAIAAGVPVVGTDIPGIAQQIADGTHGVLVEVGDVDALAGALATLLDDPDRRESMAAALSERARALSWERVTDRVLAIYEAVGAGQSAEVRDER